MAQLDTWAEIVAGTLKSNNTIREDLQDAIYNVSPMETPLLSTLQQAPVRARYTEWMVDSYASAAANAQLEGIAHTCLDLTVPTRAVNVTQIFYKGGEVSDSQRAVEHAGMDDPFVYYEGKHVVEIKRDIELALVRGTLVSGDTDTASNLGGFFDKIDTNRTTMSSVTLTETIFNNLLELTWGNTAVYPTDVYVGSRLKRTISQFATRTTSFLSAEDRKQILTTNQYDSDFGVLTIHLHRDVLSNASFCDMLVIDPNWFATGWLQPLRREVLSRDGLRDRYQISAELTLLFRNEKAGLAVSGICPYTP